MFPCAVGTDANEETTFIVSTSPENDSSLVEWIPLKVATSGELERSAFGPFPTISAVIEALSLSEVKTYPFLVGGLRLVHWHVLLGLEATVLAELPRGAIYQADKAFWQTLPLPPGVALPTPSAKEAQRITEFLSHPPTEGFYFSPDVALARRFPFDTMSRRGDTSEDSTGEMSAVVWNEALQEPFAAVGLTRSCVSYFRGFCGAQRIDLCNGGRLHVLLLGRQRNTNPGPRYLSRGLNQLGGVGNDHIYELSLWTRGEGEDEDGRMKYASHLFLRGTVPVRWKSVIAANWSTVTMKFGSDALQGSSAYLVEAMKMLLTLFPVSSAGKLKNKAVALRCLNLLRQQHTESQLSALYHDAIEEATTQLASSAMPASLDIADVDWLGLVRDQSVSAAVAALWKAVAPAMRCHVVCSASCGPDVNNVTRTKEERPNNGATPAVGEHGETHATQQTIFFRVNCADSLDRTNIAVFFILLQAVGPMLQCVGLSIRHDFGEEPLQGPEELRWSCLFGEHELSNAEEAGPLAENTTTSSSARFFSDVEELQDLLKFPRTLLRALASLVISCGDAVARVYTSSPALHTSVLRPYAADGNAPPPNAAISALRRFENVFNDRSKRRLIDLLLGRCRCFHLPLLTASVASTRTVLRRKMENAAVVEKLPIAVSAEDVAAAVSRWAENRSDEPAWKISLARSWVPVPVRPGKNGPREGADADAAGSGLSDPVAEENEMSERRSGNESGPSDAFRAVERDQSTKMTATYEDVEWIASAAGAAFRTRCAVVEFSGLQSGSDDANAADALGPTLNVGGISFPVVSYAERWNAEQQQRVRATTQHHRMRARAEDLAYRASHTAKQAMSQLGRYLLP